MYSSTINQQTFTISSQGTFKTIFRFKRYKFKYTNGTKNILCIPSWSYNDLCKDEDDFLYILKMHGHTKRTK